MATHIINGRPQVSPIGLGGGSGGGGSGFPMTSDSRIIVAVSADTAANGAALVAAYTAATALTPGGNVLSPTNRAVVILPPGVYEFAFDEDLEDFATLGMTNNYVDIVGLTGDPKHVLITSATTNSNSGTLGIIANDAKLKGVTIQNTGDTRSANDSTDACAFGYIGVSQSACEITDCIFDDGPSHLSWSMRVGTPCQMTFINCKAGDRSFCGYGGGFAGVAIRCVGGNNSFSTDGETTGGARFEYCVAGDNSFGDGGTVKTGCIYKYCTAGNVSFGESVEIGCFYYGCVAGDYSFGQLVFVGTAYDCLAGRNSFGGPNSIGRFYNCRGTNESFGSNGGTSAGFYFNCSGEDGSFGGLGGHFTGVAVNCVGGTLSFGGSSGGSFTGLAKNCSAGEGSFGSGGIFSGVLIDPILAKFVNPGNDSDPWPAAWAPTEFTGYIRGAVFAPTGADEDAVTLPDGASGEFEGCTFRATGTGTPIGLASGTASIKLSYCKMNTVAGIAAGITNLLGASLAAAFNIGSTSV